MVGVVGKERVRKFIEDAKQPCLCIVNGNETMTAIPLLKLEKDSGVDPLNAFDNWCDLYDNGGTNFSQYKVIVHDGNDDPNKRKKSMSYAQFYLYQPQVSQPPQVPGQPPVYIAAPQHQHQYPPQPPQAPVDINAAIERVVEKMQANHAIQTLSAEIAALSRKMEEREWEEEEEESEEEEAARINGELETKKLEMNMYKEIFGGVKDAVMHFTTKDKKQIQPAAKEIKGAAGPEAEAPAAQYKTPVSNVVGQLEPFLEVPNPEDQRLKINAAVQELYEHNGHLGDDLNLLVEMKRNTPKKYENLLLQLRPE